MIPWDIPARLLLLPFLVVQGLSVRRKALILPEPEGARSGRAGTGPPLKVLIVGDSSGAGVGAQTQKQALAGQLADALATSFSVQWQLEAKTGASTASTFTHLSNLLPERFDIAVMALGVNDVTGAVTRRRWTGQQMALHQLLQERFGVRRIYAAGLPPMGLFPLLPQPLRWILGAHAARLDKALAGIAEAGRVVCHVPFDLPREDRYFAKDGFHPSPPAYTLWAGILAGLIRQDHGGHGKPGDKDDQDRNDRV